MYPYRLLILRTLVVLVFGVFAARLAYLQLLCGAELRGDAERNRLRWVRVIAPRGMILDRRGRVLATNTPGIAAWLVPGEVPREGWDQLLAHLAQLGVEPAALDALAESRRISTHLPVRLTAGLEIGMVSRFEEALPFLPGVYLRKEPMRQYPGGPSAAHLLGYLREINAEELEQRRTQGYRAGDRIGKAGLERAFERELRGTDGGEQVEVNARGRVLRTLQQLPPLPGKSFVLTIDLDIQHTAERALAGHRGAVVALDPRTGDILALASTPAFDLNRMSGRIDPTMMRWLRGQQRPELNRATAGLYPPGSVFKIVTAATALEHGAIKPGEFFYCKGVYRGIHCWNHAGHGAVNLTEAIAQSCNVAFMTMAERTGSRALAQMARRFGFGQPVGILPVPEEGAGLLPMAAGVVPDPEWSQRVHHRRWELGETLQVGIGQSATTVTPLQSARMIAAIANGGKLLQPRLVKSIANEQVPLAAPESLGLKSETLRRIALGLRAVVGEGTARSLDPSLQIAGKTGTAQNPGADHAWFVGYAPRPAPTIAVAVLIEHGGHGGAVAAPIAQAIIRAAVGEKVTVNMQGE